MGDYQEFDFQSASKEHVDRRSHILGDLHDTVSNDVLPYDTDGYVSLPEHDDAIEPLTSDSEATESEFYLSDSSHPDSDPEPDAPAGNESDGEGEGAQSDGDDGFNLAEFGYTADGEQE